MNKSFFIVTTTPEHIHYNSPIPYTLGELLDPVTQQKQTSVTLSFSTSENESEWERLADAELHKAGFKRLSNWTSYGTEVRALIQKITPNAT